jgi:inorganic pyrophosphatase
MAKNNYLEPHKTTLTTQVDKALQKSLKKENIKSRCKVSGIWPLNFIAMVGKCGPSDVFIIAKEEEHELSYHLGAIDECNNSEVEIITKFTKHYKDLSSKISNYS